MAAAPKSALALPALPWTVQTGGGKLTISEKAVTLEKPSLPRPTTETIARSRIVSLAKRVTVPATFGRFGGLDRIEVNTEDGRKLTLARIPHKYTAIIEALLSPDAAL